MQRINRNMLDLTGYVNVWREQVYTATAGQTDFKLPTGITYPVNRNMINVFLNGDLQRKGLDYTEFDNTTIKTTEGLRAGDVLHLRFQVPFSEVLTSWPEIKIEEAKKVANVMRQQTFTVTEGQTVFSLNDPYAPGTYTLSVYLNGIKQRVGIDYLETDNGKVTFTVGLKGTDRLEMNWLAPTGQFLLGTVKIEDAPDESVPMKKITGLTKRLDEFEYKMKASNGVDDTQELQSALNVFSVVNLNGLTVYSKQLTLKTGQTVKNGTIKGVGAESVFRAESSNTVALVGVTVDGQNTSAGGVLANNCSFVTVENCTLINFKTRSGIAFGVNFNGCSNSKVINTKVENVLGVSNNVIGDELGTSRGILFGNTTYSKIEGCYVKNILGSDDADGIHLNSSGVKGFNVVIQNRVSNCESRMMKIQQSDNKLLNNELVTEQDYTKSASMRVAGISIYESNIVFDGNLVKVQSLRPIQLGAGNQIDNITISNNDVDGYHGLGQGCIVLSDAPLISNCNIFGNKLKGNSVDRVGVDIRTFFSNLRISNNSINNVIYAVLVRTSDGTYLEGTSARTSLLITDNTVVALNHLLVGSTLSNAVDLVTRLVCTNNMLSVTSVVGSQPNSVYLSSSQYGKKPVVSNNSLSGVWLDGLTKTGSTASRPTVTDTGFNYFDTTLGKPIWWNGSVWKDASGTTV